MPDITVTESFANPDHFGEKSGAVFYSSVPGGTPMVWVGTTADAVGTYGSPTSIVAEEFLRFSDADTLWIGSCSAHYESGSYTAVIGSTTATEYGQIEFVGNQTTNLPVGVITWHNVAAAQADKIIVKMTGERLQDNDGGEFNL